MSKFFLSRTVPAVLAVTLLSSAAAFAAPLGVAPVAGSAGHESQATPVHMRGGHMGGFRHGFAGEDRVEGRIAFLKAELKITDAQTSQWEAVAKAMRDQSAALKALQAQRPERVKADGDRALTAPEILTRREQAMDYHTKAMAARAEGQKQFAAAFTKLYAQLSDEQKKTADSLLTRHGRGRR